MQDVLFSLASFMISAAFFIHGALKLFRKRIPMYFQLLICAAGCYALEELSAIVNFFCRNFETPITVGILGFFACLLFMLSANYGQLDRIVDDGRSDAGRRARITAVAAPVFFCISLAAFTATSLRISPEVTVAFLIVFLPAPAASYFNLKHILLPMDDFGFLRATRPCNAVMLAHYVLNMLYIFFYVRGLDLAANVVSLLISADVALLVIFAERGVKKWGI